MRKTLAFMGAVAACGALVIGGASSALADPPPNTTPKATDIVGAGSDTIEFVMDSIAQHYDSHTVPAKVYSYDATGSATITPKTGAATITRPDGSGNGITALESTTKATLDFARSSRARAATDPSTIRFVAMGIDAVTVAVQNTTNAPANLTTKDLQDIYTCKHTHWNTLTGNSAGSPITIKPFLPQSGSGTRSFFESAIGITDAQVGSCVTQGVQENEGTNPLLNNPNAIVPYSIAKYIAQVDHPGNGFGSDEHGTLKLESLNSHGATKGTGANTVINSAFSSIFQRLVYNVVRTDNSTADGIPTYLEPIFGANGYICTSGTSLIEMYGFAPLGSACGSVS
jgi:ABC-type phosphate transport system substrate-binding protein